jgi:coenzyme F420-reducing hydrogenase alpha subunit
MNILYKTTLVLLVIGVHSVGARKLPSKSANRRYGNDHEHRPSSFFNSRSDNNQKDKKNIGTTKRKTNGTKGVKGVNTKHQHIATKIVGGFTTNPQSSRQNHVNMLRRATTTTTRTNMGVSSSSSNQKDSYKRLQIPNTNPYSLNNNKYQYKYNTHTHTQKNNPMTMREQRNGNEQNFVTNSNPPTNVKKYRTIHRKQRNGHGRGKLALSSSTMAMSSPSTYLKRPSLSEYINSLRKGVASTTANIDIQDYAIFLTYICTQLAISKYNL